MTSSYDKVKAGITEAITMAKLQAENEKLRKIAKRLNEWNWPQPFEKADWEAIAIDAGLMKFDTYQLTDAGRATLGENQ